MPSLWRRGRNGMLMDVLSIPREIKDAVCLHQLLRKAGIPTDDLFLALPREDKRFGIDIKGMGVIILGRTQLTAEELSKGWEELSTAINNRMIGDEALNQMLRESVVSQGPMIAYLATVLVEAGYKPPGSW